MSNLTVQDQGQVSVKNILQKEAYKKRFNEILGAKSAGFISSIMNVSNLPSLQGCAPQSVINSAVVAATLDLPIDPNLGFSYIVPYNDNKQGKIAQFQMGYKGFIQLAMRTGQYKTINAGIVYQGEIKRIDKLTGDVEFSEDPGEIDYNNPIGYFAHFQLLNGFSKTLYMSKAEIEAHAKTYSQSYKSKNTYVSNNSLWAKNFDTMAQKTVLKRLLSKFGILSIEMQKALVSDQAAHDDKGDAIYPDNVPDDAAPNSQEFIDAEYTEDTPGEQPTEATAASAGNEVPF